MKELFAAAKENLSFLLVCLAVFAALVLLAVLAERLRGERRGLSPARSVSFVAMFSAVAAVLMLLEIPLFFAPSFYKLDLSELPVLICAFYLGPTAGVVCEFLKVALKLLLKGTTTAFVGDFANFAVGCSFVLPAAVCYRKFKTKRGALFSMAVGTVCLTAFGSLFNAWYLLPKFCELYGMPMSAILEMSAAVNPAITSVSTLVLFAVVPFNLLKGVLVSALTFVLYKRVERLFFRTPCGGADVNL